MITFKSQHEMMAWMVCMHACLSGKNSYGGTVMKDATNTADMVVGMFRMRTPDFVNSTPAVSESSTAVEGVEPKAKAAE